MTFWEREAASSITKKIIGELKPALDVYQIRETLAETTEAVSVIMRKGALPLGTFYDVKDYIWLADKGSALSMKQLLQILYNLQVTRNAAAFLKSDPAGTSNHKRPGGCAEQYRSGWRKISTAASFQRTKWADGASSEFKEYQKKHSEAERGDSGENEPDPEFPPTTGRSCRTPL